MRLLIVHHHIPHPQSMSIHRYLVSVLRTFPNVFACTDELIDSHASFRDASASLPRESCAQFHIKYAIGHGSQGCVYLANDKLDDKTYVAVKTAVVSASLESGHAAQMMSTSYFSSAIMYWCYLDIVDEDCRILVTVSRFCEAGDLRSIVKERQQMLPEKDVARIVAQCAMCLYHLHRKNIIHRDVKTRNIFVNPCGTVQLGDYGFAKHFPHSVLSGVVRHSEWLGTPYYMAPELWQRRPYNSKIDMWSLGVVAYELITLTHPFKGRTYSEICASVLSGTYASVQSIRPDVSQTFTTLLTFLLCVDTTRRLSALDFLATDYMLPYLRGMLSSMSASKDRYFRNDADAQLFLSELDSVVCAATLRSVSVLSSASFALCTTFFRSLSPSSPHPRALSSYLYRALAVC